MCRIFVFMFIVMSSLMAFESTNIQLLYSNGFDGDAFIYDVEDGKKTTITFEHYRTFSLGDIYMFVDIMDGEKFDGTKHDLYTEISPRFSFSKLSGSDFSFGMIQDIYIATQINAGSDYTAYLGGFGADISVPGFNFVNLNIYYKSDNIAKNNTYQITPVYQSKAFYGMHFEGFADITERDINTQNQLLFNLNKIFSTKEQIFIGAEWIYYSYDYDSSSSKTNVLQAMLKYQF
ncbi:MAG: hypothetical protein J7L21_04915 [Sulfurimonas sp.]|nr:hypothetical protein [Sulfurimonas sp.]